MKILLFIHSSLTCSGNCQMKCIMVGSPYKLYHCSFWLMLLVCHEGIGCTHKVCILCALYILQH